MRAVTVRFSFETSAQLSIIVVVHTSRAHLTAEGSVGLAAKRDRPHKHGRSFTVGLLNMLSRFISNLWALYMLVGVYRGTRCRVNRFLRSHFSPDFSVDFSSSLLRQRFMSLDINQSSAFCPRTSRWSVVRKIAKSQRFYCCRYANWNWQIYAPFHGPPCEL